MPDLTPIQRKAVIGDVTVLILLTVAGFATHLTLDAFWRMTVTTLGVLVAWFVVAPFLGVYEAETIRDPRRLWRIGLAWFLAAPLATFLRGAVLARDIPPVFVVVVMLTNGFALVAWRIYLGWTLARRRRRDRIQARSSTSTNKPL